MIDSANIAAISNVVHQTADDEISLLATDGLALPRGSHMDERAHSGVTMILPKKAKPSHPIADQERFLSAIETAAKRAARRAREENDRLGLAAPAKGKRGEVAYRLRGKIVAAPGR